jgi:UDP-N-acetylglucosamine transferase subunit ALG13
MIFVITGTGQWPFDRLVVEVDRLVENDLIQDEVYIQLGSCTYLPKYCSWKRFLDFGEICRKINESIVIVAHAGAGITLLSIQMGHKPILVPRRKKYGELVDDHQLSFSSKICKTGLVSIAHRLEELSKLINEHSNIKRNKMIHSAEIERLINYLENISG